MKWFKRIGLGVVVVILLALVIVYFSLNGIVRSAVERQASASLNVPTTLGGADLAIFGGKVSLSELQVGSPPGYSAPHMFTLHGVSVAVHYGQLTGSPIHINSIVIDNPNLLVEQANLKLNIQALTNQPAQAPTTSSGQPTEPIKLIIDQIQINNATVSFMPGLPGMDKEIDVNIPSLQMNNIGNAEGAQNGAAIRDVVIKVIGALAEAAAKSGKVPVDVNHLVDGALSGVVKGALGKNVSPETENAVEQGLQGLFSKKKK